MSKSQIRVPLLIKRLAERSVVSKCSPCTREPLRQRPSGRGVSGGVCPWGEGTAGRAGVSHAAAIALFLKQLI